MPKAIVMRTMKPAAWPTWTACQPHCRAEVTTGPRRRDAKSSWRSGWRRYAGSGRPNGSARDRALDADHGAELLHGCGTLLESRIFFGCQLDLDDLFQAGRAQLAWHADVEAIDAVLALKITRTRQNLL